METEHTFLLQVIVRKTALILLKKKDDKSVGFESGARNVQEKIETDSPKDSDSPLKVKFKFHTFPYENICEDSSPLEAAEKRERLALLDQRLHTMAEYDKERNKYANDINLTLAQYKEILKEGFGHNDIRQFKRGQCFMFQMTPSKIIKILQDEPIKGTVLRQMKTTDKVGSFKIGLPSNFVDTVSTAVYITHMKKLIAEKGMIFFPREVYEKAALEESRKSNSNLDPEVLYCSKEERELCTRFKDFLNAPKANAPCRFCINDPCSPPPKISADPDPESKKKMEKLEQLKKEKLEREYLLSDSPHPIEPPSLPVCAEVREACVVYDDHGDESGLVKYFIRLICYGTTLRLC